MVSLLVSHWAEALTDPRASARRILRASPTPGEAVSMALAAFALSFVALRLIEFGLGVTVTEALAPLTETSGEALEKQLASERSMAGVAIVALVKLAQFVLVAILGWRLGVLAGGEARFEQVLAIVGWHALATAPLDVAAQAFLILSAPGLAALGVIVMAIASFYAMYLLAAFLAEAHGFESVGQVLIAMIGVMMGFVVLVAVFGGMAQAATVEQALGAVTIQR